MTDLLEEGTLLDGLEVLEFSQEYSHPIPSSLLSAFLVWLQFRRNFDQCVKKHFLSSLLKRLWFQQQFDNVIEHDALVRSLECLKISQHKMDSLVDWLPPHCKTIG